MWPCKSSVCKPWIKWLLTFLLLLLCGVAHEEVLCWLLPRQGKPLNLQGTECCLQGWLGGVTLATFPNCRCLACLARNQPIVQLQLHGLWERLVPVQFHHIYITHPACTNIYQWPHKTQTRTETTYRGQHKKRRRFFKTKLGHICGNLDELWRCWHITLSLNMASCVKLGVVVKLIV